jgi:hypothetical protein
MAPILPPTIFVVKMREVVGICFVPGPPRGRARTLAVRGLGDPLDRRHPLIPFRRNPGQESRGDVEPVGAYGVAHLAAAPPHIHEAGTMKDREMLGDRLTGKRGTSPASVVAVASPTMLT